MEMLDLNKAEEILNRLLSEDACVPVLSLLGHLHGATSATHGRHWVLRQGPCHRARQPMARDERRRYRRYSTY